MLVLSDFNEFLPYAAVVVLVSLGTLLFLQIQKPNKTGEDVSAGLRREEGSTNQSSQVLNPAVLRPFKLVKVVDVSYNTKLLRFDIPGGKPLGLPIGRHVSVGADIDGNRVLRAYTPTSPPDCNGYFDLLVKKYDLGKMSMYLHNLPVGGTILVRGPVGRFKYLKNKYTRIGLVAGGTGLTPCLQLMRCVLETNEGEGDDTKFTLLFQNRGEADILLKDDLDSLEAKFPSRVKVLYYLSNPGTKKWASDPKKEVSNQRRGYISSIDITTHLAPEICPYVCMCGPSGFNNAMEKLLLDGGHTASSVFIW